MDKCRQRHLHHENLDLYPTSQSIYNPVVYTEIEELRVIKQKLYSLKVINRHIF